VGQAPEHCTGALEPRYAARGVSPAGLLRASQLSVNQRVWLYALGLSVLAGIIVGLEILFDRHRTGRHMTDSIPRSRIYAASSSREWIVARSEASRAMNRAVMLPENVISHQPVTLTATICTESSVGPTHNVSRRGATRSRSASANCGSDEPGCDAFVPPVKSPFQPAEGGCVAATEPVPARIM
jgi:hypothetical protein